jgi:hypothetical protein
MFRRLRQKREECKLLTPLAPSAEAQIRSWSGLEFIAFWELDSTAFHSSCNKIL